MKWVPVAISSEGTSLQATFLTPMPWGGVAPLLSMVRSTWPLHCFLKLLEVQSLGCCFISYANRG